MQQPVLTREATDIGEPTPNMRQIVPLVMVAALGYFVDIYDLLLFSIVRIPSLTSLGLTGNALQSQGILLLNLQMIGMLIGGILWGVMGDKRGRLSVLYGSILTYSLANLANAFVTDIFSYGACRLIAGIGLAGELGAGITLVAEVMPRERRGLAATLLACIGLTGAIAAYSLSKIYDWRTCYIVGGVLGLSLLTLRFRLRESALFSKEHGADHKAGRGDFLALFRRRDLLPRYIRCIIIGLPTWYVVGILITFSNELGRTIGVIGDVDPGRAVAFCYAGLVAGDIASGLLSQALRSRLKVMGIFMGLCAIMIFLYHSSEGMTDTNFYWLCMGLGFSVGSWVIFVTIATEQFGTNLRATVTTTVSNFVRGAVVPLTWLYASLQPATGMITASLVTGAISLILAAIALIGLPETFAKDLDYTE